MGATAGFRSSMCSTCSLLRHVEVRDTVAHAGRGIFLSPKGHPMRSSSLVSLSAMSAIAFAPVAVASITALPSSQSQSTIRIGGSQVSGTPRTGITTLSNGDGGATFSAFSDQGISLNTTGIASGAYADFFVLQSFQSSNAFAMTWNSVNFAGASTTLLIGMFDDYTASGGGQQVGTTFDFVNFPGPLSFAATTGNQYYRIYYASAGTAQSAQSGQQLLSISFGAVPAPGAIALLGLAGLSGRRRRG